MTRWLEWLLDLQNIRLAQDAPLLLQWDRRAPAWLVFTIAVSGVAFIVMVYRRERTSGVRRITLALFRSALLAVAIAAFCKPNLVLQRNRVEPSYVALLVDTSASMGSRDADMLELTSPPAPSDTPSASNPSRLELVQAALQRNDGSAIARLFQSNGVQFSSFSDSVEPLVFGDSPNASSQILDSVRGLQPDGLATDLAGAISDVLTHGEGRRLAAIVLATDGRATRDTDIRHSIELAAGRQIPIYALAVGSERMPTDIEVGPLRAPQIVFLHDMLAVEAQVAAHGLSQEASVDISLIELAIDSDGGETVATERVTLSPTQEGISVELRAKPGRVGTVRYRVEAAVIENERNIKNNFDQIDITVTDDRLRVLYVESYPRYEYRYLKNALLREKSMDLSVLLLDADSQFVQEGTLPIRRFPDTPEELSQYDVVLFGDVDPRSGWLTQTQMLMLLDFVANEGGGFAVIAGERSTPHRFLGTPLERLVPIVIDPAAGSRSNNRSLSGFHARITAEGHSSRIFRFAPTAEENRRVIDALPELYWMTRTLGAKPGTTVLAEHPTLPSPRGPGGMPIVVLGQYGAGKIYFQATDDTWRWRRHTGELIHDSFWVQMAREILKPTRVSQDRKFVLRTDRRTYPYGAPVHIQAEVFDPQLLREHAESMVVGLYRQELAETAATAFTPTGGLVKAALVSQITLTRLGPASNVFEGSTVPAKPGGFSIEPTQLSSRSLDLDARGSLLVRVETPDLETRNPTADFRTLENIASATGGRVVSLDDLNEAFAGIRDRKLQVPDDIVEPLWDSKLVVILFAGLLTLEWCLRKAFGLL